MSGESFRLVVFTIEVALAATTVICPFAVLAAFGISRCRGRVRAVLDTVVSLPLVLPPTAVGLLLLEFLRRDGAMGRLLERMGVGIVFTWKAVVLATAVMSFPLLVRSARSAFEDVDPRLPLVARTLGRGPIAVFFRIHVPLASRGILAGILLAFARALGEFGATMVLAGNIPGRTQTLALAIFQRAELGDDHGASQYLEAVARVREKP